MKFLVYNYSSTWSTDPLYFCAGLNLLPKNMCSATIYNNNLSVYDNFDSIQPSHVIIKYQLINEDFLDYLLNNNHITPLINIDGMDISNIDVFNEKMISINDKTVLFGAEHINMKNYLQLIPCADLFINKGKQDFSIDKLIFVRNEEDISEISGSYHYTTDNPSIADKVDFILPITSLNALFPNYKEVIFKDISYIGTQLSFNAIYNSNKVIFDIKQDHTDKLHSIFKGQKLAHAVKHKHTCLHRTKTMLNHLSLSEIASELDKFLEKV